jgi:hypothetical protein
MPAPGGAGPGGPEEATMTAAAVGSPPAAPLAGDPTAHPEPAEGQPTQQWNGAPTAWGPAENRDEAPPKQAPPARSWELSDTGHSIPPYPSLPEPVHPPRRIKQGLILALLIVVLMAGVIGFLGFVSPGFFLVKVLDPTAVQTGVQKVLTNDYGLTGVDQVRCSQGNRVVVDAKFECQATVAGGQVTVPIRITSDSGDYEVGRPAPA